MEVHYSNSCQQFSANIYSTHALHFWLAHRLMAFIYLFVYKPTCTTLGLTLAHNQMNRVSGVDSTSLQGAYLGVLSDTPTECVTQCANVPSLKQTPKTPCKPCTKQDMCMKPNVIPLTPQGHANCSIIIP